MSRQYITAKIQNLAKKDILEMIPQDTITRIKQTDPKPEFKVFCVGHEGTAQASELTMGGKVVKAYRYVKEMILKLGEKLQYGTIAFNKHGVTNEHDGRDKIGELVGKSVKMIGDKLSTLAAIYVYPEFRKLNLNVASIEAEVAYTPGDGNDNDVVGIDKITGIALGQSGVDQPAFPGATLLGVLQNFSKETQHNRETGETMKTKDEVKDAIRELGLKVTDIFTETEITSSEPAKKAKQTEYEHAKRVEEALGKERENVITLTKERDDAIGKVKTLNERVSSTQVGTLFAAEVATRKLDDKEKAFISKNLKGFKSDKEGDELKNEFNKFLDSQLTEYVETAKLLGVEIKKKDDSNAPAPANNDPNVPSADGQNTGNKPLDDPAANDFIPKP